MGLASWGAIVENTLLVDDSPYKNVMNNPYNAIHPQSFTYFFKKSTKNKPYLLLQLWPFLQGLKELGLSIPVYCREHSLFGSKWLFPKNKEHERFKTVWLKDQRGFKVPYVDLSMPNAPYTNVGGPSNL